MAETNYDSMDVVVVVVAIENPIYAVVSKETFDDLEPATRTNIVLLDDTIFVDGNYLGKKDNELAKRTMVAFVDYDDPIIIVDADDLPNLD